MNDYILYHVNHDPQERLELLSETVFASAEKDQNNNSKIQQCLDRLDEILKEQNTDPEARIKAKIYLSQELLSKGMLEITAKKAFNLDVE